MNNDKIIINRIKELLYGKVEDYNKSIEKENRFKNKLSYCQEILRILDSETLEEILYNLLTLEVNLNELFDDEADRYYLTIYTAITNINKYMKSKGDYHKEIASEFYRIKKIRDFVSLQERWYSNKLKGLVSQNNYIKPRIIEYRRIISAYKYGNEITHDQIRIIKNIMDEYDFDDIEKVMTIELTKEHNRRINPQSYNYKTNSIIAILKDNLQKYELPKVSSQKQDSLDVQISSIISSINMEDDLDKIKDYLPEINSDLFDNNEFEYIMKSVINSIISDLLAAKELLVEKETYNSVDDRVSMVRTYNDTKRKLNRVKSYYSNQLVTRQIDDIIEKVEAKEPINNIIYLFRKNNETTYFEKDLEDIPHENLETIGQMLEDFENDSENLTIKGFNNSNKAISDLIEIKNDQIRIIFKNIGSRNYLFLGVALKKDNMPKEFYNTFANRARSYNEQVDEKTIENSRKAQERIMTYINNNKRKTYR